jgi:hypothetical protein
MSVWGRKLTSSRESSMSVLPLEADIHQGDGYVSFVPITEVAISFDRRVGAGEQRRWDFDTQRFGSLEVDD